MRATGYNSWRSWIVTIACVIIGFLIQIPIRIAGLIFVILIDTYDTDRKTATLPIVIFGFIRTLTGPFVGFLGELFGLRCMTIVGCFMSAVGVGSLYFAEDMTAVIICLGVIYGLGAAGANSFTMTIITQHFNKNINLAFGTFSAGSTLGVVVMTPIIRYLVNKYGVSGMFLLLSGILLHSVPAAILLKDPKNELRQSENSRKIEITDNKIDKQESSHLANFKHNLESEGREVKAIGKEIHTIENLHPKNNNEFQKIESETSRTDINQSKAAFINDAFDCKSENLKSLFPDQLNWVNFAKNHNCFPESNGVELLSYTKHRQSIDDMKCTITSNKPVVELTNPNFNSSSEVADHQISKRDKNEIMRQCLTLFADPTFHLIMFTNSILAFHITLNWTIIADYAADKGIDIDHSVYFVMFLPVAEMLGSLGLSWVVDLGFVSKVNFCMIGYLVMAADAMLISWSRKFAVMMVGVMIFGFNTGVINNTLSGVIVEYIEKNQQNMAFVCRFTLYGLLCLAKIPLVGYFRDVLGSYKWIYYIITSCSILCAICMQLIPIAASYREKKELIQRVMYH